MRKTYTCIVATAAVLVVAAVGLAADTDCVAQAPRLPPDNVGRLRQRQGRLRRRQEGEQGTGLRDDQADAATQLARARGGQAVCRRSLQDHLEAQCDRSSRRGFLAGYVAARAGVFAAKATYGREVVIESLKQRFVVR